MNDWWLLAVATIVGDGRLWVVEPLATGQDPVEAGGAGIKFLTKKLVDKSAF